MLRRQSLLFCSIKHQIAIIGSGPAGCYVAQQLLKTNNSENLNLHIDIYEKLPVPFGLSRYGVAPDHPEVKNVEKTFNTQLFEVPDKCTLLCNVDVGTDVTLPQLRQSYSAVVLATGCSGERRLGIPGEHLSNVISSKRFVEWYNTYPFSASFRASTNASNPLSCPLSHYLKIDQQQSNANRKVLTGANDGGPLEQVVLIGNGNVALDIARVLSAPYQHWCPTDMNAFAIRELMSLNHHNVRKITIVARREVEHSAFTTKEFRELTNLDEKSIKVVVEKFDLEAALERSAKSNENGQPTQGLKRKLELMKKYEEQENEDYSKYRCVVIFRFGLTPTRIIPAAPTKKNTSKQHQVGAIVFQTKEQLKKEKEQQQKQQNDDANNFSNGDPSSSSSIASLIPADAVITCTGYLGEPIRTFPFDKEKSVIPSDSQGRVSNFLYSVGWARYGPKGVIASSLADAKLVAKTIADDLKSWDDKYKLALSSSSTNTTTSKQTTTSEDENEKVLNVIEEGEIGDENATKTTTSSNSTADTTTAVVPILEQLLLLAEDPKKTPKNIPRGKYDLVDHFINNKVFPLGISSVRKIWRVEIEKGVDLGKRMEKVGSVSDMLNLASGGKLARKTEDRLRGRPILGRPRGLELMSDYLDPKTMLADMSEEWMKKGEQDLLDATMEQQQTRSKPETEKFLSSPTTANLLESMEPNIKK